MGGIITFIARKMRVGEESGINKIEGNNRLDLDTLTTMFFIRPYGMPQYYQYEWIVNRAQCLIILPNTGVVDNLLYVGTNPHVQEGHGDDEEEEAGNLQDDLVHHEAGGKNDNDWWAWMQTKIQRISTKQQRQCAEISRLRCDVQRGNHMH